MLFRCFSVIFCFHLTYKCPNVEAKPNRWCLCWPIDRYWAKRSKRASEGPYLMEQKWAFADFIILWALGKGAQFSNETIVFFYYLKTHNQRNKEKSSSLSSTLCRFSNFWPHCAPPVLRVVLDGSYWLGEWFAQTLRFPHIHSWD